MMSEAGTGTKPYLFGVAFSLWLLSLQFCDAVDGSPPRLEGRPARVHRVRPGSSLRLRCPVASGSRPFRVEWSLDGERIDPATWTQHSFAGPADRTLRVRRVGKEEKGIYTCKGVNGYGSESFDFSVVVSDVDGAGDGLPSGATELLPGPMSPSLHPVPSGSQFSLTCSVSNPGRDAEMRWLKRLPEKGERERGPPKAKAKDVVKLEDGRYYRRLYPDDRTSFKEWWDPPPPPSFFKSNNKRAATPTKAPVKHFMMTLSSASAREDSTAYACMVVSSLVDLDKTFRYKTSEVEVLPQASTGERNGALQAVSRTSSRDGGGGGGESGGGGVSGLTVAVIVLPAVTLVLLAVLFMMLRGGGGKDKGSGGGGGGESGGEVREGEKGNATLDTSKDASSSLALLQPSDSFTGRTFPVIRISGPEEEVELLARASPSNSSSSSDASTSASSASEKRRRGNVDENPPSTQMIRDLVEQQQQQQQQQAGDGTLRMILDRPRFYQLPSGGGRQQQQQQHSPKLEQRFAGISRGQNNSHSLMRHHHSNGPSSHRKPQQQQQQQGRGTMKTSRRQRSADDSPQQQQQFKHFARFKHEVDSSEESEHHMHPPQQQHSGHLPRPMADGASSFSSPSSSSALKPRSAPATHHSKEAEEHLIVDCLEGAATVPPPAPPNSVFETG